MIRWTSDAPREYAAEDADITLQLHRCLYPEIAEDEKLEYVYRELEMPAMEILFEIERNGVLLDLQLLENQSRELGEKMLALETGAYESRDSRSIEFHETDSGDAVRAAQAAGAEKDPGRSPVHR